MLTRAVTVVYIVLCFAMGLLLLFVPWLSSWTANYFVHHYPWIGAAARNYYARGAVSGIGLADIGLGVYEAWRYRQQSRALAAVARMSSP
jgi:hypothetical protein